MNELKVFQPRFIPRGTNFIELKYRSRVESVFSQTFSESYYNPSSVVSAASQDHGDNFEQEVGESGAGRVNGGERGSMSMAQ